MNAAGTAVGALLLVCGCATREEPAEPMVVAEEAMTYLDPGLRPEVLLFPEYLLMDGFRLARHGRIPETRMVGAGMEADLPLAAVRRRFQNQLDAHGWKLGQVELGPQSFRLMATRKGDNLEIRTVQGTGPAEVFILYRPAPVPEVGTEVGR